MLERWQRSDGSAWENTVSLSRPDHGCTRISSLQVVHLLSLCKGRKTLQRAARWCSQWDLFICKSAWFFSFLSFSAFVLPFLFFVDVLFCWGVSGGIHFITQKKALNSSALCHSRPMYSTYKYKTFNFSHNTVRKTRGERRQACPQTPSNFVTFYGWHMKLFLQTNGQTEIRVYVWNFMCMCVSVPVCIPH